MLIFKLQYIRTAESFSDSLCLHHNSDDCLILVTLKKGVCEATNFIFKLCFKLEIHINCEKSLLTPTHLTTFLGIETHSSPLKVFPISAWLGNLCLHLESFLSKNCSPAKDWMSFLGHMSSHSSGSWSEMKEEEPSTTAFMDVGQTGLRRQDSNTLGQSHNFGPSMVVRGMKSTFRTISKRWHLLTCTLYMDSLRLGWETILFQKSVSGLWTVRERSLSITFLELRAICLGPLYFTRNLQGRTLVAFSDNTTHSLVISGQRRRYSLTVIQYWGTEDSGKGRGSFC